MSDEPYSSTEEGREVPAPLWKQILCLLIPILVYVVTFNLPSDQRWVATTFAFAVTSWMTEALPLAMTALVSTCMLVATGALSSKDAFGAYGDQIILLFVGSFIIAKSMEDSGLDRRISYWLLSRPFATRSAGSILLTLGTIACVISLFVSNTATTAMLLPIGRTILRAMNVDRRGNPISTSVLLMLTWGSSIAVGTIIGTPPNVLGVAMIRKATGISINFVQWAIFAMPITILMLMIAWLLLKHWQRDERPDTNTARSAATVELKSLGRMRDSEKVTMIGFAVALSLWLLPGTLEYAVGSGSQAAKFWSDRVPEAVAALAGALVLFVIPCRDRTEKRAMTWGSATKIEWGTILLFAGGLALGKATFESGLAKSAGESLATSLGATNVWAITALSIGMSILLSELASNTASANIMAPVAIALAQGAHVNPIPPALGAVIGSNLGFMLPISTPPNAIVYSSGLVPSGIMLRAGLLFDLIGFGVTFGCLYLILPPMGLA
jgi:sodium-dependent dicarboxylate transporter 2/3/5